jgi:tetratricopeptide (TPR) repeat protein
MDHEGKVHMKSMNLPAIAVFAVLILGAGAGSPFAAGNDDNDAVPEASVYSQAVKAVKSGKYKLAIGLLTDVLRDKPRDADALNYMGYSHRKTGDYVKAVAFYKRALAEKPDHLGANEYLGEAYFETGKLAEAEQRLARLKSACGGCEEYPDLNEAVAAYKAKR